MDYYNEIKKLILNNEINRIVKDYSKNKNDLNTYFDVGKLLSEYQKEVIDDNIIKECSIRLTNEIGKGYSVTNLKYMIKFYLHFKGWKEIPAQLNWSHYVELLTLNDTNKINYYIKISLEQNLSYRELHRRIINNEYENLDSNIQNSIINNNINKYCINHFLNIIKQPNNEEIKTKIEQKLILENITNIIELLGNNFSFIASKYKIKINNRLDYIDLLLYDTEINSYVVVKFKITEVDSEDINHIKNQINYIDKYKRNSNQNKTIGIIICKKDSKLLIEYCSDNNLLNI